MKHCLSCGTAAPGDATDCAVCGREFAYRGESTDKVEEVISPLRVRPDGTLARGWGLGLIGLGVVLGLWSGLMPVTTYSFSTKIDSSKLATKALLAVVAQGSFGLGLVLWLAGYIVYAISFLPGRDD